MPFLLLVAVICAFPSCSDQNEATQSPEIKQFVGTWRVYPLSSGQKVPNIWWYRIYEDATIEQFWYDEPLKRYVHSKGTCQIVNGWLTIDYKKEFIYGYINGLIRGFVQYMEPQPEWKSTNFLISSVSNNEIKLESNANTFFLEKEAIDPALWPDECKEQEIEPAHSLLAAQWDLRSYYAIDGNNYQFWYFENPETQGMALTDDGKFTNMQFLVKDLALHEINAGRLEEDESITIHSKHCAWALINGYLDFVCSSYEKVKYDERGAELSREVYEPLVPIIITYYIHFFTSNWLTIYKPDEKLYFSFRRNTTSPAASPAVSANAKGNRMAKRI